MTKQIFGRDTVTGECGWFTPIADAPDVFITGLTIEGDTVVAQRSDGATFPVSITHPAPTLPETDGVHLDGVIAPVIDLNAQTITYATLNDLDETPAAPLVMDISAIIAALTSSEHPNIVSTNTNATVAFNAANNEWEITVASVVDTNTDTWNVFTLQPNGDTLVTEQNIAGPTGNTYVIPAGSQNTNTTSVLTPTILAGNEIGTHTDGAGGAPVPFFETITSMVFGIAPDFIASYFNETGAVVHQLSQPQRQVQIASFFENRTDPVGTLYSDWIASMPIHTVTYANPWSDRSCQVVVQGSARPTAGWGGANGGFDARASVRVAGAAVFNTMAVVNVETIPNLVEGGGGDEQFQAIVATIPPGGTVDLEFLLSGLIPIDAGATQASQQILHTYIVSLERYNS